MDPSRKTHLQQHYYRNFLESIRTKAARETYDFHFKKFTQFIDSAEGNLLNENPRVLESRIIDYIIYLRNKGRSHSLISTAVCAISHFYTMNDIVINKKKINKFVGARTKKHKDTGYNTNQIRRLLEVCDDRIKVMVLLFASTGMRLGALATLKMRNLRSLSIENDKQIKLYHITIYEGEPEEYITFCTPECSAAINSYVSYRERSGEKIVPNTPLVREQFDKDDIFKIKYPRHVLLGTISKILSEKLIQAGIREVEHIKENQTMGQSRKEIPLIHGFRKFFNTALMNSDVHPSFKKLLMGHSVELDEVYYDNNSEKSQAKLLEEYCKAINALTINEENRLKLENQEIRRRNNILERDKDEVTLLRKELEPLLALKTTLIKEGLLRETANS